MMAPRIIFGSETAEPSVVSIGSFDGVHLGHQDILTQMGEVASSGGWKVCIATFDPHPRAVLGGLERQTLTTLEERGHLLQHHGIDRFIAIPFSQSVAETSPEAFVEEVLVKAMGAKAVIVGYDHRFGKDRRGDVELLRELGLRYGFSVHKREPVQLDDHVVSSSLIRGLIAEGEVEQASQFLGRRYAVTGTVIKGAGRGKGIGVPTANLRPISEQKLTPGTGVYAVMVQLPESDVLLPGMMNIGTRPTFEGLGLHLEVNILNWSGDLYDRELRVEFAKRLRNEQKFASVNDLIEQLNKDRERCRRLLEEK